jgi:hypothetical protein
MHLTQPTGIHLVTVRSGDRTEETNLMRGIVYAFAIQGAAAIAVVTSWLLLRS